MGRAALVAAVLASVACASSCGGSSHPQPLSSLGQLQPAPPPGKLGAELIPIPNGPLLAPQASQATPGKSVDGIKCESNEKLVFHVHAHIAVFVDGKPRVIPAGIGIRPPVGPENYHFGQFGFTAANCQSWLSTHYPDGIVHVEAPVKRSFVLGDLFDVWGQPLGRDQVGPARGAVTAIVNGSLWTGDPRRIPLRKHSQIQLEVGKPLLAYQPVTFHGAY
jgi:hypothetical protein